MTEQHELFVDKSVSLLNTGFSHHLKKNLEYLEKMGIFFPAMENYWNLTFFLGKTLEMRMIAFPNCFTKYCYT